MPTYQYACTECGEQLEMVQKFSDDPLTVCPACSGRLRKVFSPVGIVFKGSGFYRTDSRASNGAKDGAKAPRRQDDRARQLRFPVRGLRRQGRRARSPLLLLLLLLEGVVLRGVVAGVLVRLHQREGRLTFMSSAAGIGVIGGSGFYEFLDAAEEVKVDTPFGPPSDPVTVGEVAGRRVAFLPRHGRDHRLPPHRIPYRANLWALRSLGVRQVIAPSAVGSLTASFGPGTLVVPDQLIDRTSGRTQTFYDQGGVHVSFADPYCASGREQAISAAGEAGWAPVPSGTLVVIEGQRFSTRAESQWFAAQGWTLVGMTGHPETVLARELALCYIPLALVTDLDAGIEAGEGVTQAEVFKVFAANVARLRDLVAALVAELPSSQPDDACAHALDGLPLPFPLP